MSSSKLLMRTTVKNSNFAKNFIKLDFLVGFQKPLESDYLSSNKQKRVPLPSSIPVAALFSSGTAKSSMNTTRQAPKMTSRIPKPSESKVAKQIHKNLVDVSDVSQIVAKANVYRDEAAKELKKSVLQKSPEKFVETNQELFRIANELVDLAEDRKADAINTAHEKLEEVLQNANKHSDQVVGMAGKALQAMKQAENPSSL